MTRILHLINGQHYSGAERVQDLLALCLPDEGFEVEFACVKPDRFAAARKSQDVPLVNLPMRGRLDLTTVGRLAGWIRRRQYALVHAHTPRTAMVGRLASALTGVPFVYHVHSPTSSDSTRAWQNRFNALGERCALIGARRLIAVSESLGRHMLRQGISPQRLSVVPNGVPEITPGRPPVRPEGTWTLGTVALFRPRKGIEVLLEAFAKLRAEGLPVRLRCVGGFESADYEAEVKRQALQLGLARHIDWTGFTSDVPSELVKMDLMVLPSLFGEGLPMVVLEAMAAGVPVVATRVEGVPEAIRDRLDGLLAEPSDAQSLARAIREIVSGEVDWLHLAEAARARHAARFSDRAMAAGVAEVYRQVLAVKSAGASIESGPPCEAALCCRQ